jgi:hypothetical protein
MKRQPGRLTELDQQFGYRFPYVLGDGSIAALILPVLHPAHQPLGFPGNSPGISNAGSSVDALSL